ncbi:MAG: glutathione S-transferase family protein [Rhodospirillales bacterium]|nr:glutathione S-transferase family protein [Rhodospirillales bacterium]
MADGTLYLGNRRYSSWSLRGWLAVRLAGLDVEEVVIPLTGGDTPAVKAVSPSGLVPCLVHRGATVWETIAIGEYCAEIAPALWPDDRAARAHARAIAAEMHAGFRALREAMPMNLGRDVPGAGRTEGSLRDIARIEAIWRAARTRHGAGGPFLFGARFTLADAMYAPVVARFLSYRPQLAADSEAYCAAVRGFPLVADWYAGAAREPTAWLVAKYEAAAAP